MRIEFSQSETEQTQPCGQNTFALRACLLNCNSGHRLIVRESWICEGIDKRRIILRWGTLNIDDESVPLEFIDVDKSGEWVFGARDGRVFVAHDNQRKDSDGIRE